MTLHHLQVAFVMLPASRTLKMAEHCDHTSGYYPRYVINYGRIYLLLLLLLYQVAQLRNTAEAKLHKSRLIRRSEASRVNVLWGNTLSVV